MLTGGARLQATFWCSIHAALRRVRATAGCSSRASELSNLACRLRQAIRTVRGARGRIANGVRCVPLLLETFGGLSPPLVDALRTAAEWRKNKLTASEYDRRDDLVSADVDGLRDAAAFRRGAAVDGAGGGGGPRPVGGGRPASAVRA
eukprot:scaffold30643_cov43-Phaeocystis_antarctica.AAC.2